MTMRPSARPPVPRAPAAEHDVPRPATGAALVTSPSARAALAPDLRWLAGAVVALLAIVTGVAVAAGPAGVAAACAAIAAGALVLAGRRIPSVFHFVLAGLLLGYLILGRGFAYLGAGGLFVGELGVALAVIATAVSLGRWRIGTVEAVLLAFLAWGAIRTIPYLGAYGVTALRDAVSWGYALIAVGVATTLTAPTMRVAVRLYGRLALPAVLWFPVAAVLAAVLADQIPAVPGSPVPVIYFKSGDAGVHLAAIAAFVLVGLYRRSAVVEAVLWTSWGVSAVLVAALSRGGMVAASTAVFALLFVRRLGRWLLPAAVATVLFIGSWLVDPTVDLGLQRQISFQQLIDNATSIFVDRPNTSEQGTKEWRLAWWEKIVDYTVDGPYFWTGKGFGINLADDDGFQVLAGQALRSPHSAHFEILARTGVPGIVLWVLLQAAWAAAMFVAALRARRTGRAWWLAVVAWLFIYWLAAIVNMSVDVYLSGPQGGIWFWAVFGAGLAVARMIKDGEPDAVEPQADD